MKVIKETMDAVRVAEMEAEKQISTAKENAADKKGQAKSMEADYRTDQMNQAKSKADALMDTVVKECDSIKEVKDREISEKVSDIRALAENKKSSAVKAVIEALV